MSGTDKVSAIESVRELLLRRFRVVVKGGRIIEGDFQCLDKQGNLVLGNAVELLTGAASGQSSRQLGMVLIPEPQQQEILVDNLEEPHIL